MILKPFYLDQFTGPFFWPVCDPKPYVEEWRHGMA